LPHQVQHQAGEMVLGHKLLHHRRQKQRLIDFPGAKGLAHVQGQNLTRPSVYREIRLILRQPPSDCGRGIAWAPRLQPAVLAALAVRISFLFAAAALPSLTVTIVKRVIGRARPFVGGHLDPYLYAHPVWRPDYASMPSGHATTAFAAAVAVALLWPRLRVPMLIYAFLIAASRVVLDAHYMSDVLAGAAVGVAGALLVRGWVAARRLGFANGADGRISRLPGPSLARLKRVARGLVAQ